MKLEDIGFYTLTDERAKNASATSPLQRCELILTDKCNFRCGYCMPLRKDCSGTLAYSEAASIVTAWAAHGLQNIRFSGGEPTLWKGLASLVKLSKYLGIKRVAISTNGSNHQHIYADLINAGVDDVSISLDACCASTGDTMSGRKGSWDKVVKNIEWIAKRAYTTVGIVLNENNQREAWATIDLADKLGVSDIRIIPASQYGNKVGFFVTLPKWDKYPILNYRLRHIYNGKAVRGLTETDTIRCPLALDDMAVAGKLHFPCIIYMRQRGEPIGDITKPMREVRKARELWCTKTNTHKDPICSSTCLDVCVDYNNRWIDQH